MRHMNRAERRASATNGVRLARGEWRAFREITAGELAGRRLGGPDGASLHGLTWAAGRVFANNRYVVFEYVHEGPAPWGRVVRYACRRTDGEARHDWYDLQRIKDELVGPEARAVEVYPPASELVDDCNLYHLWVWPEGQPCPFDLATVTT